MNAQVIHETDNHEIKVFSSEEEVPDTTPTLKSVVHFGWLQPLRGRFPFFYEKNIGGSFGVSAGLGLTYADFFRSEHWDILLNDELGTMGTGFHGELLAKWYIMGLAIEDVYIGVTSRFSSFNYKKFELGFVNNIQERHYQSLIVVGTQYNEWGNRLVYDYYIGFGAGNIYSTKEELVNIGGEIKAIDSNAPPEGNKFLLRIGVKMGLKIN